MSGQSASIAYPKEKKEAITMTLRLDRKLQQRFDRLSAQSDYSRNRLMCMALQSGVEQLERELSGAAPNNEKKGAVFYRS